MKKLISLFLTFAMLFSLAMPAMAAEGDSLSTVYIDVGQLENAASVQSVYLSTETGYTVNNEPMTHVSGTIYSYDISAAVAAGDTVVRFQMFSDEGNNLLGFFYYTTAFEAGKNLWTATGENTGTWSVYGDDGNAGIPSAPSDGGNANDTMDVTASYTPSPEAKWGTDAENLTGSGTLAEAIDAATAADSTVGYIQLQSSVTIDAGYEIRSGVFTLDLNGNTLTSNYYNRALAVHTHAEVTLTDTATGGAVISTGYYAVDVVAGKVVINGGSYTSSGDYVVSANAGSSLTITGGTFTGGDWASVAANGTTTITGGTFTAGTLGRIAYWGGTMDLSEYDEEDLNGLTIYSGADLTVSEENIKLPTGYVFKDSEGNTVTTLANGTVYTIANESSVPTYNVIIADGISGGTVTVDKSTAAKDEIVTLTITPAEGYELDTLTITYVDANSETQTVSYTDSYTFVMPAADVTVTATFKAITYAVKIDESIESGTVTVDKSTAAKGENVTVTVEAEAGFAYVVNSLKVTNDTTDEAVAVDEATKSFVMPDSSVTVYAEFEKLSVTSAEIVWGSMSFTYSDEQVEQTDGPTADKGWTDSDTGWVTVKNTGNTTFTAKVDYTAVDEYAEIEGEFDAASAELAAEASKTFTLTLNGKPNKAIPAGTKIGSVTITINEAQQGGTAKQNVTISLFDNAKVDYYYSDDKVDLATLVTNDAGLAMSYARTGGTGTGTITDSVLDFIVNGTHIIEVTTAETDTHNAGSFTFTITVTLDPGLSGGGGTVDPNPGIDLPIDPNH